MRKIKDKNEDDAMFQPASRNIEPRRRARPE